MLLYLPTMLRGAELSLSAEAALASMNLILAMIGQGRSGSRQEQRNMRGDAEWDRVHAGSDQVCTLCDRKG